MKKYLFLTTLMTGFLSGEILLDFDIDGHGNVINPGQKIDDEYSNLGVTISVKSNRKRGTDEGWAFDTNDPTGGDDDLLTPYPGVPSLDNVLIIQENKKGVPDDEGRGGTITFTLDHAVTGMELGLLDIEETGIIDFYLDGVKVGSVPIVGMGDHSWQVLTYGGVYDEMKVRLGGSGAIGFVKMDVPEPASYLILGAMMLIIFLMKTCIKRSYTV